MVVIQLTRSRFIELYAYYGQFLLYVNYSSVDLALKNTFSKKKIRVHAVPPIDPSSPPGVKATPPAVSVQNLSLSTTRDALKTTSFIQFFK